ncbi:zinc finger protein 391-like isoform X2 [Trachinotus anak]|uniref:zinc finger protein 391-like isoform X2 n=1 Tax=Trachinotus anak TaxID=443729 RepID=UPI0039F20FFA
MKLDSLRRFVDQRLSAVTDDIFRRLARTIAEYEHEVFRLKQELDRQRRQPETARPPGDRPGDRPEDTPEDTPEDRPGDRPGDRPEDTPEDTPEDRPEDRPSEEQQMRGRSFSLYIKQEEGGASVPEDSDIKFTQSPDGVRERPETDLSPPSNQIQSYREEAGPQTAKTKQEEFSIKQEVGEGHMMLEAAVTAEISSLQKGVLLVSTTEDEQQVRGRSLSLHFKQEEGGASGPEDSFTPSPDWLIGSNDDEGSSSSCHVQPLIEECLPAPSDLLMRPEPGRMCRRSDHHRNSAVQSESSTDDNDDVQSQPGLQRTRPCADQKLLICSSCGRGFSSRRTLRKHIRRNTAPNQDQMSCSLGRQRAPFQSPAKSFNCRVCGSSFYTQGILVRHAENHCKEPESRCGACGDHLDSTETLRDHLRSHKELGSTCDVCGKKCSSIRRMEIRKRVHTGEKPYRCSFCSRDFSRKESLKRHLRVHSGDRSHRCGL